MTRDYGPSAKTLVWGLGLFLPGVLLAFWWRIALVESTDGSSPQGFEGLLVVLAVGAAVVGLVVTLLGVWQLATNVDIAARASRDAAYAAETAQARADREAAAKANARARLRAQLAQEAQGSQGSQES